MIQLMPVLVLSASTQLLESQVPEFTDNLLNHFLMSWFHSL